MTSVKTAISIPESLLSEVDQRAADAGASRSAFIQQAIRHYLEVIEEAALRAQIKSALTPEVLAEDEEFMRRSQPSRARLIRDVEW